MARHFTIYLTASGSRASNASYLLPGIAAGVLMVLSIPAPALGGERQMPDRLGEIEQSSPKLPRQPTAAPAKKGETTKDPSKDRREKTGKAANSERELGTSDPMNVSAAGDPAAEGAPGRDRDMDEHPLAQWTRKLLESKTPAERELAERALEGWQKALLEPGREVKGAATHEVRPGETLSKIAASYGTTPEAILRLNCQVKSSKLVVGQKLKVLAGPFEARVDLASCRIRLIWRSGILREFPCCVGDPTQGCATPAGTFRVVDRVVNPMYTAPDGSTIPGGRPDNPIGFRWIKFAPSLGIHGTNEPETIGRPLSRGCVRMRNEDVEWLYDFLPLGSSVIVE